MNAARKCVLAGFILLASQVMVGSQNSWIAAWATSPQYAAPDPGEPLMNVENQTVRERVRLSLGGGEICIRFSNEYGSSPLVIGSVTVALPEDAAKVRADSIRSVTFGGRKSLTIPAGAPALSDPVTFAVSGGTEITISIYFPQRVATPTWHEIALRQAVVSQRGDHTRDEKIDGGTTSASSILIDAVLVPAQPSQRLVVAFGDSTTDGAESTPESDRSWPSSLARRLAKTPQGSKIAVVNEGIAGNRLLNDCFKADIGCFGASALARFDRDALALPGVTHIVLFEGINDIAFPGAKLGDGYLADPSDIRSADDLINAYRQLILRAHTRGIKLIGATITPFEGVTIPGYYSQAKEAIRQEVNRWIRSSGLFDGVIDFDAVLRDPDHPSRLLPRFASQDHLHPNDAGYQAMADTVDLTVLQ